MIQKGLTAGGLFLLFVFSCQNGTQFFDQGVQVPIERALTTGTFTNPIVAPSGGGGSADPWVTFKDGYYYYCRTLNDAAIGIAKASRLQDIGIVPLVTIWTAPANTAYSKEVWAPELHWINGAWYIYFAADDGNNVNHRMYCLSSNSSDAQGGYTFRGKVFAPDDKWAIDGTVLKKSDGSLYFVWSGCEVGANFPQNLYIAPMSGPTTISGSKVMISTPTSSWETQGAAINEGPEVVQKNGKISIVYSASASWLNEYCLGLLSCSDGNVLNRASWTKKAGPVFSQNAQAEAYGTGHASFVPSPNGGEDWIVYHAFQKSNGGWGNRSVRTQRFSWNADNTPNLGTPVGYGAAIMQPAGTALLNYRRWEAINFQGNLLRHQNGRGRIDFNVSPYADSEWIMVPGLSDASGVSFQSLSFPGSYLRHRNGEVWLDPYDGSVLFRDDATFYKRPGLFDSRAVSFQSKNFPANYIRHRNGLLYSEPVTGGAVADATFWER